MEKIPNNLEEERFRYMLQTSASVILCLSADHKILEFNNEAERLYGRKREDVLGKDYLELFLPKEVWDGVASNIKKVLEGEPIRGYENPVRIADGSERILQWSISRIPAGEGQFGIMAVGQDITERRLAKEALRENEERFRSAFENAAIGMDLVWLDGRFFRVNDAFCKMLGYSEQEMLAMSIRDISHPEDMKKNADYHHQLLAGEITHFHMEKRYLHKRGHIVWALLSVSVVRGTKGDPIYFIGQIQDITERKQTEDALRFIAEGTATVIGADFFRSIAHYLALALQVRYVLIAERMQSSQNRVRTLAVWAGKEFSEDIEYDLDGTPCGEAEKGEICFYPDRVQELFPGDSILVDIGAQSYLGIPLLDSSGTVIGHLAVLDDKPMDDEHRKRSIAKIFAARVGAELERKWTEEKMRHMAYHDPLTDLPNHALFYDRLQQAILAGQRENESMALLLLDLDHFKDINDTFGHHHGNRLLQQVGHRMRDALRKSDTIARLGGDEFAVILPGANMAGATMSARKILEALERSFEFGGLIFDIRVSIGIVLCPVHGDNSDLLIQRADKAMYAAKESHQGYAVYAQEKNHP